MSTCVEWFVCLSVHTMMRSCVVYSLVLLIFVVKVFDFNNLLVLISVLFFIFYYFPSKKHASLSLRGSDRTDTGHGKYGGINDFPYIGNAHGNWASLKSYANPNPPSSSSSPSLPS